MPTTVEQSAWLEKLLGFAAGAPAGGVDEAKGPASQNGDEAKGGFLSKLKKKEQPSKPNGSGAQPGPGLKVKDQELADALKTLDFQIEGVENVHLDTKQLKADRQECAEAGAKAEQLAGDDRDKALKRVKKRIDDLFKHARALAKSAQSVIGDGKNPPTADQKTKIYTKAIEDHYGIKIKNPDGMQNTHLDRVFDMLGTVPIKDAKQSKLKKLLYKSDWGGSGAYNRSELTVKMGDFGDASDTEDYEIDGVTMPVNSFNVTTLHEIGHAVDFKHGVMKAHRDKAGCGGWEPETVESITTVYVAELKKTAGLGKPIDDGILADAVNAGLASGTTTAKPDEVDQADWEKVVDFITDNCLPIRAAAKPWFASSQVVVNQRVYQEAYADQWWSYDPGARTTTKVNGYQWRAPGEWFAEIYAITWLKKKKPPSGVDQAAAEYMWKG